MSDHSHDEERSRARHPSSRGGERGHARFESYSSPEACGLAGRGHYHLDAKEEPAIDGQLGNDTIVFYRHVMDTRCHGLVMWEWTVDLDAPDVEPTGVDESTVPGPERLVAFTEEGASECDYCLMLIGHADEQVVEQAKGAYARLHTGVSGRVTRIANEMESLPASRGSGLSGLRAFFRGEGS